MPPHPGSTAHDRDWLMSRRLYRDYVQMGPWLVLFRGGTPVRAWHVDDPKYPLACPALWRQTS